MMELLTGGKTITKGYNAYSFLVYDIPAGCLLKIELFSNMFEHTCLFRAVSLNICGVKDVGRGHCGDRI